MFISFVLQIILGFGVEFEQADLKDHKFWTNWELISRNWLTTD
jgi:hypothetical protein